MEYSGDYYEAIADFLGEKYLDYGFAQGTNQEADFLQELLNLPPGSAILDVGCGPGRHSLALARRGYATTGIDISARFIEIASRTAQAENLPTRFEVLDARKLAFDQAFDAAICLCEGAFGLAGSEAGHRQILTGIQAALRPGARFVLTVMNALNMVRRLDSTATFDFQTATVMSVEQITNPDKQTRSVEMYPTAFTYRELKWLLEAVGFQVEAVYGCTVGHFQRLPPTLDDIELMLIARKQ